MDVTVTIPNGTNIRDYAWPENLGKVVRIGVFGPGGWNWSVNPYFIEIPSGSSADVVNANLTTGFESWNPEHFRGVISIVDENDAVAYLKIEQFIIDFNGNNKVVVDDGSGGLIIDFYEQDGNCESEPEGEGEEEDITIPTITFGCPNQDKIIEFFINLPQGENIASYAPGFSGQIASIGTYDHPQYLAKVPLLEGSAEELRTTTIHTSMPINRCNKSVYYAGIVIINQDDEKYYLDLNRFDITYGDGYLASIYTNYLDERQPYVRFSLLDGGNCQIYYDNNFSLKTREKGTWYPIPPPKEITEIKVDEEFGIWDGWPTEIGQFRTYSYTNLSSLGWVSTVIPINHGVPPLDEENCQWVCSRTGYFNTPGEKTIVYEVYESYHKEKLLARLETTINVLPVEIEGEGENRYHPADLNNDWQITLNEAIACLVAWQAGGDMSNAIRAAYLWQNGENYTYAEGDWQSTNEDEGEEECTPPTFPESQLELIFTGVQFDIELSTEAYNADEYQWYFEGSQVEGANESTLNIPSIHYNDEGLYYVIASNSCGIDESKLFDVRVFGELRINMAYEEGSGRIKTNIYTGVEPNNWIIDIPYGIDLEYLNQHNVELGIALMWEEGFAYEPEPIRFEKNGLSNTVVFDGTNCLNSDWINLNNFELEDESRQYQFYFIIRWQDDGVWQYCSINNGMLPIILNNVAAPVSPVDPRNRYLNFDEIPAINPPTITLISDDTIVNESETVTLWCQSDGIAPLSYQWQRENVDIADANQRYYRIDSAAQADAGIYTCVVTNAAGSTLSPDVLLEITSPN